MRMRAYLRAGSTVIVWSLLAVGAGPSRADGPEEKAVESPAPPGRARKATERGLAFLERDAAEWRAERKCATCHHGTMTVWALSEAKDRGYPIDAKTLTEVTTWTRERLANVEKPRDSRPGWNMVSTPAVFLAVMAEAIPAQAAITPDDLRRIAGHLLRHQEDDGSWAWSLAPARNRPPPVFESDEVVTMMADTALGARVRAGANDAAAARASRARAAAWLGKVKPGASAQAVAVRLFRDVREGRPRAEIEAGIRRLLAMQHEDGGWGQEPGLPSDAYATGQALYFLSLAGVARDRAEIRRAVAFLVANQKEDGSWPMTSRAHPGAKPMTNPVPITYFGSAWATLGLLRSVPK